ncbi:MAG: YggS family pyridoxal phosphate-dependent enzyme [Candidatus Methylumidiphilus sp.]
MNVILQNLALVRQRLREAERQAGRPEGSAGLIAVGKTWPAAALAEAYRHGQRDFGENYLQEALAKQDELKGLDIVWHFIGPIQSNKTRPLAERFHWIHGIDRLKIAKRISEQRPDHLPPVNLCIQVNVSGEPSKAGVSLAELLPLAESIAPLPRIRLRGLMAIPAPVNDVEGQRRAFRILREALAGLGLAGMDTLSMGMSDDLEAAVMEGATLVRIGTAIFGGRV